jgi:hypothetical protein
MDTESTLARQMLSPLIQIMRAKHSARSSGPLLYWVAGTYALLILSKFITTLPSRLKRTPHYSRPE